MKVRYLLIGGYRAVYDWMLAHPYVSPHEVRQIVAPMQLLGSKRPLPEIVRLHDAEELPLYQEIEMEIRIIEARAE